MVLFTEMARRETRSAYYAEPRYSYLNATARPPFERVRILLERWAGEHPALVDKQWLGRFQSEDDRAFLGAFFELYTCAVLTHQGFTTEREPVGERGKRVEFRVSRGGEPRFLLECRLVAGSDLGSTEQKRINRVYDAIDRLTSPDFFVGIQVIRAATNDPPGAQLRAFLKERLGSLDPEETARIEEESGFEGVPHWRWSGGEWEIEFWPITKRPEACGKEGVRPLGMLSTGVKVLDTPGPIVSALKAKASRYGRPDMAYVVAIDALETFASEHSIEAALFGKTRVSFLRDGRVVQGRAGDGFWLGARGPQHKRVSAVLFAFHLVPWSIKSSDPDLWHNPWADHALAPDLWAGRQMLPDTTTGRVVRLEGRSIAEILGLPAEWPGWDTDNVDDP